MRLFIAIELPENIKKEFARMRGDIPGARWVAAEQIHLTLAFLGEVEEATGERLTAELSRIHSQAFKLRFAGTGCFPDRRRPRVLWVGLEPEPLLTKLVNQVRSAVLACGIPQEERPFSPHITLARLKAAPSHACDSFLDPRHTPKLPPVAVGQFTLFQSRLNPHGAEHIPLTHIPLHGLIRPG